jgi:hypothetical protein
MDFTVVATPCAARERLNDLLKHIWQLCYRLDHVAVHSHNSVLPPTRDAVLTYPRRRL